MYKSKEIRWFTQGENKTISRWFAKQGLSFNTVIARRDYYLVALDYDDIVTKLREGKIEIKHKVGTPIINYLTPNAKGYFEEFVKWSFKVDTKDALSGEIINGNKYATEWVEVYKERMGIKLTKGNNGTIKIHDIKDIIDNGCQIEYTRIKVKDKVQYSFNLEWFGDEFLNLDSPFISEIFGDSVMKLEDSMGYGTFLKILNS